jgi:hypothetical protein
VNKKDEYQWSRKSGILDVSQPYGPPRPVTGISLLLALLYIFLENPNFNPSQLQQYRDKAVLSLIFLILLYDSAK